MTKTYLDWNVISQMKNGNHAELSNILFGNHKFYIPFSTSHIADILSGLKKTAEQYEIIKSDLEYLSQLTKDICVYNNGNNIVIDYYSPIEMFQQSAKDKDTFDDISLNGLIATLNSNDVTNGLGSSILDSIRDIPIEACFLEAFSNPQTAAQMELLFPGLKENPTMEGFFESFSKMNKGLNEEDTYKDLRGVVQSGLNINRDKIYNSNRPFESIDQAYRKTGFIRQVNLDNAKYAPQWFNEISDEFLHLDMHGYQEDRINTQKGRNETFRNTCEDAFHAEFASTCHFYITSDKKGYNKCKQVYDKLNINTLVLKPDEFVEYYKKKIIGNDSSLDLGLPSVILEMWQSLSDNR